MKPLLKSLSESASAFIFNRLNLTVYPTSPYIQEFLNDCDNESLQHLLRTGDFESLVEKVIEEGEFTGVDNGYGHSIYLKGVEVGNICKNSYENYVIHCQNGMDKKTLAIANKWVAKKKKFVADKKLRLESFLKAQIDRARMLENQFKDYAGMPEPYLSHYNASVRGAKSLKDELSYLERFGSY